MTRFKIVETDNFNGDYPNESFVNLPGMAKAHAHEVANAINKDFNPPGHHCSRYWKVVPEDYVLQPGFEP